MDTIRISMSQSMEKVISELEERMLPLSRAEIIKAALAEMYRRLKREEQTEYLSALNEKNLAESLASRPKSSLKTEKEIRDYFKGLME